MHTLSAGASAARRTRGSRAAAAVTALPLVLSAAAYAEFIGRSSFSFQGQRYFALVDDAMVSMTYGRNLAHGHGLVWNAGQHVEGYTNFLWTLWMAFVHLLPFGDRTVSLPVMVTSALLLLANLVVVRRICALLAPGRPLVAAAAVLATGLFYPLMYWALRGMEVGLATLLVSTGVLLALELHERESARRRWVLAAVLALAVLTRDDLLIPALIILAFVLYGAPRTRRRAFALSIGGTIVFAVAAHTAYRVAYYGDALPNTYYLKLAGIPLKTRVERGSLSVLYTSLTSLYAPLLLALTYLWTRRRSLPSGARLLVAVFVAQCAYDVYVGGDAWEEYGFANRYLTVVVPLVFILAALCIDELVRRPEVRRRVAWLAGGGCLVVALVLLSNVTPKSLIEIPDTSAPTGRALLAAATGIALLAFVFALHRGRVRYAQAGGAVLALLTLVIAVNAHSVRVWGSTNADGIGLDRGWAETGVLVRQTTSPNATIAMSAGGNTQYFDHRRGIDEVGKMDPVIAHMPPRPGVEFRPGHVKWDYDYSIGRLRPDVVTQLYLQSTRDICNLRLWGYRQTAPELFVRPGAGVTRPAALARGIAALHFWPFVRSCGATRG